MNKRKLVIENVGAVGLAVLLSCFATACAESTSPSQPSSGGSNNETNATSSVTVPQPLTPAAGALVRNADQPIALVVRNAAVTQNAAATYTFEVASDAGFASKVFTRSGVAQGTNGQTSLTIDRIAAGADYFWRARAEGGGTIGPFSAGRRLTVGPEVILQAPVAIAPLNGAQTALRPALCVRNAARQGPAGAITYRFDIATTSAFTTIVVTGTQPEGVNETGFIPTTNLPVNTTFFWRAFAMDAANGVTSAASAAQSFTTTQPSAAAIIAGQLGVELWPGIQPPGTLGHATMGNDPSRGVGWQIQTLHYLPTNVFFQSPDIEMLRFFDLFDRGFDPESAITWMNSNGYPTAAQWYPPPEKAVLGLRYVYIAARDKIVTNAIWDIVLRVE